MEGELMKSNHAENESDLKTLAEELLKNKPDKQLVRILMRKQGIPYVDSSLHQINAVLTALNQPRPKESEPSL
jgi:hypothetical protein